MRNFLWCHGNGGNGKSKVAWEVVFLPKVEGGLGIRRLECFNSALMTTHIWKLLTLKESLWVKWIHEYKLNGRNFWDIPLCGNMSWGWRKILKLRPLIREFIWHKIGNGKLKTQDFIRIWDVSDSLGTSYSLCEGPLDSHDHLIFECSFAHAVWDRMKVLAGMESFPPNVYDVISDLMPIASRRTSKSVVAKLVVAASTYYIWQERNWRLFNKGKRSLDQVYDCIKSSVRLKLLSCRFKKSKSGDKVARLWDLLEAVFR
ncbi:reverse transcriptase zinc-binding domain-containing protein [Tanacetum coccineum]